MPPVFSATLGAHDSIGISSISISFTPQN